MGVSQKPGPARRVGWKNEDDSAVQGDGRRTKRILGIGGDIKNKNKHLGVFHPAVTHHVELLGVGVEEDLVQVDYVHEHRRVPQRLGLLGVGK